MREFIDGATAIARGALAAGCRFFAGYPITPATPILLHMLRELPKVGGVGIQAEDEIASIGFCIGASMAGMKAMTATSGPGISLYSENIGLAIMGETPLVIIDVMRLGPATGGATTVAQGDVQFIQWGTSGGYPIIALCPTSVPECYEFTIRAFNLAERFRIPVFLATDKEIVMTMTTVDLDDYPTGIPIQDRVPAPSHGDFVPYAIRELDQVPLFASVGGPHLVRFTTSTHDEYGFLVKDPVKVGRLNEHLAAKIEAHQGELEMITADLQKGADTLLISYGITARSMLDAVRLARARGRRVSALTVYSLWPVPGQAIRRAVEGHRRVVVAELNLGQYRREIVRIVGRDAEVVGIYRVDGELITPEQILEQVR